MPLSNNPRNYPHIQAVLDTALAHGGGKYDCGTEDAAWSWRQKAYHFRKISQRLAQDAIKEPGVMAPTLYDNMYLTLDGPFVVIQYHDTKIKKGLLTDLKGKPIELVPLVPEGDSLIETAERLKKDLIG